MAVPFDGLHPTALHRHIDDSCGRRSRRRCGDHLFFNGAAVIVIVAITVIISIDIVAITVIISIDISVINSGRGLGLCSGLGGSNGAAVGAVGLLVLPQMVRHRRRMTALIFSGDGCDSLRRLRISSSGRCRRRRRRCRLRQRLGVVGVRRGVNDGDG